MKRLVISLFALSLPFFVAAQNGTVKKFTANGFAYEMVYVEGGTYQMGETGKTEETTVGNFHIGKTEVTQELWKAVMGKNPSTARGRVKERPVETVSWSDCKEFIEKLNQLTGQKFRLPTEEEWEYAAYGGQDFRFAGSDTLDEVGWYVSNSGGTTHPVAQKKKNGYGLYDMSGNVWEWVWDPYGKDGRRRHYRGGSGYYGSNYSSPVNRGSNRSYYYAYYQGDFIGFRLVCPEN